jgi:4-cresol dehydrogenase (hydroxylating)
LLAIVGAEHLELDDVPLQQWSVNTLDSPRKIQGIIRPRDQAQVQAIVLACLKHKLTYSPVSSGKNWGYGGATPVSENVLMVDLSRLKGIVEFNAKLSYVVVEPGVTQQDLFSYMRSHGHEFMVPTTGAGPQASLLGNALERGYGITPVEDHFGSLLGLKAVLPDGRIYRSALHELGGDYADQVFKWKTGPYLDGLFTQSNFGIVLEGVLGLAPKPENVTQFVVFLPDEEFENAVEAVREIKLKLGGIVGGVNLMNKRRLLSMVETQWNREQALEEIRIIEIAKKRDLPDWAMVGALYGPDELVRGGLAVIRDACKGISQKVISLSRRKYEFANRMLRYLPLPNLRLMLANAGRALEILEGTPSRVALPLAYLKNKQGMPEGEFNPDRDGCGLIWFAPLIPLDPPVVRDYIQEVATICLFHDVDPLITLTAISQRCLDSTIPILFSKGDPGEAAKAKKCYDALLSECARMGLFPYRLDIDHMHLFGDPQIPAFWLGQSIKKIMDPHNLLSPGRYSSPELLEPGATRGF